jgi:pimeloyl-ACP methyl ester carboxylesterase
LTLSDVKCPVVAILGDRDDLEPYANVQRLLPQLPQARSVVMPGLGHFAPWVWPELPLAILNDLAVGG